LRDKLSRVSTITSTRSTIVLETMKETTSLPVEAEAPAEVVRG